MYLYTLNKAPVITSRWLCVYSSDSYTDGSVFESSLSHFFFALLLSNFKLSLSLYCTLLTLKIITLVISLKLKRIKQLQVFWLKTILSFKLDLQLIIKSHSLIVYLIFEHFIVYFRAITKTYKVIFQIWYNCYLLLLMQTSLKVILTPGFSCFKIVLLYLSKTLSKFVQLMTRRHFS